MEVYYSIQQQVLTDSALSGYLSMKQDIVIRSLVKVVPFIAGSRRQPMSTCNTDGVDGALHEELGWIPTS